jgi:glucosyl-dolichyl phosphate glucuronosyltransferase
MASVERDVADVSVVICAYTEARWDDLVAAVESVQQQVVPPEAIIVVVDHNPGLLRRARAGLPGAHVVENVERRGLSGARNSGIATAHTQVVAFLDDDAVADPNWLAWLRPAYDDPNVLGAGGSVEPVWSTGRPEWFPREFDWVVGCTYRGMPETVADVRNLIGCNMSLRRAVFERVGGFRPEVGRIGSVPLGCEETELCIRARRHWPSGRFVYDPRARVRHRVPSQRAGYGYFQARCLAEGRSKAMVSRLVGAGDGLTSEWSYTLRVLPRGVLESLKGAASGSDAAGLPRAGAIVAGLALTAAGYAQASLTPRRA